MWTAARKESALLEHDLPARPLDMGRYRRGVTPRKNKHRKSQRRLRGMTPCFRISIAEKNLVSY
jgi:hypothetical protein